VDGGGIFTLLGEQRENTPGEGECLLFLAQFLLEGGWASGERRTEKGLIRVTLSPLQNSKEERREGGGGPEHRGGGAGKFFSFSVSANEVGC